MAESNSLKPCVFGHREMAAKRASETANQPGFSASTTNPGKMFRVGLWSSPFFVCRCGAFHPQVPARRGDQGDGSQQKGARHDQIEMLTERGVAQKVMERRAACVKSIVHQNRRDDAPAGEIVPKGNNDRKRCDDDGVKPERRCCPSWYKEKGQMPARPDQPEKQ